MCAPSKFKLSDAAGQQKPALSGIDQASIMARFTFSQCQFLFGPLPASRRRQQCFSDLLHRETFAGLLLVCLSKIEQ
jgi:hypothetical protein